MTFSDSKLGFLGIVRTGLLVPLLLGTAACPRAMQASRPEASAVGASSVARTPEPPPSIVIVLADDLRADALGVTGHPFVETPSIDRLAREGVVFDNAFAITAICCPSRATLLSGLYTHRSGVPANKLDFDEDTVALLPSLLQERGYATGFVGKYHLGTGREKEGKRRAMFDHWVSYPGPQDYVDGVLIVGDRRVKTRGHSADVLADHAVAWVKEQGNAPFFLLLALKNPHLPLTPAPRHRELYGDAKPPSPAGFRDPFDTLPAYVRDRISDEEQALRDGLTDVQALARDYARMVSGIDDVVGRLVETLQETGALDRTLVLFTSDHGLMLGEHGLLRKGIPYDPSIRVPLIARLPGRLPAGRNVLEPVLNVDIAPTLLELAGIDIPGSMTGRSVLPLVDGKAASWREDWLMMDAYRLKQRPDFLGVRGARWKYVRYLAGSGEEQLFDLSADPDERTNLAGDPTHVDELENQRRRLQALMADENVPPEWFEAKKRRWPPEEKAAPGPAAASRSTPRVPVVTGATTAARVP